MALTTCPDCEKQVSTKAPACPHCGASLKTKVGCLRYFIGGVVLLILLAVAGSLLEDSNSSKTTPVSNPNTQSIINNAPFLQTEFETKRNEFYEKYRQAPNEIKKSAIWRKANEWTKHFYIEHGSEIIDWYGKINRLSTDQGGDVLHVSIGSSISGTQIQYRTMNNRFSDLGYHTMPEIGSRIYEQASNFKVGDYVYFSLEFVPNTEDEIWESSLTELGSLQNPEFIVWFRDIGQ